jgi:hypothetical protein
MARVIWEGAIVAKSVSVAVVEGERGITGSRGTNSCICFCKDCQVE